MKKLVLIFFIPCLLWAQDDKWLKKGDEYLEQGNVNAAMDAYQKVLDANASHAQAHYKISLCYIEASRPSKALEHANKAVQLSAKPSGQMYFALASALHLDHQFDKAVEYYKKSDPGNTNKKAISKLMNECAFGKKYISNPEDAKITNAGNLVNSDQHEYLPYMTADRSKLFFTSRRSGSTGAKKAPDGMLFEDIYMCLNKGGAWDAPQNVKDLNTEGHDACVGISEDGQLMFVYKGSNGGDLYMSELKGKQWSKPEPLPFNSPGFESTATLSPDGRTIYFVYAATATGNRDIYMCSRTVGGTWSRPVKVPGINTEYDEDSPFIHPDGKTLYFSSKGHSSMGGYDIFSSERNGGVWSTPRNLGYPINTAGDELYFVLSADAKLGFYSSDKEGGFGKQDLYSIRMPVPDKSPELELLTGVVKDASTQKAMEATITVTDNETNEIVSKVRSNGSDGKYLVALPCGKNYGIAVEQEGHLFHSEHVELDCGKGYKEVKKEITLVQAKPGAKVVLRNIFFDTGKSEIRKESGGELQKLVKLMKQNPGLRIEISGHTDDIGDAKANVVLSEERAQRVLAYLQANGIARDRLVAKGYGSAQPIASNQTEEGRQQNRRTEFKIL
ncbi:MAG: OmpA family protein [Cytophagaceae bacterium]|jgi:outer membrane protein OmpA-like peptidoglycan-associated protein|nr:OmpA family protein [Cytophagaceae bacterium]